LRQDQITAFQTDPSVRVALLGITAAGVAVTLTAASTVWFAELFWTPAIMIQAEDRCHRIGQYVS
jgi:SWI/SNF-related matrix-associated actin-dependent regulator of chromatin subfamily A-like protein 1